MEFTLDMCLQLDINTEFTLDMCLQLDINMELYMLIVFPNAAISK